LSEAGQVEVDFSVRCQIYRVINRIDDGAMAMSVVAIKPSLAQRMRAAARALHLMRLLHLEQMELA
jgi:hypothetical protein